MINPAAKHKVKKGTDEDTEVNFCPPWAHTLMCTYTISHRCTHTLQESHSSHSLSLSGTHHIYMLETNKKQPSTIHIIF